MADSFAHRRGVHGRGGLQPLVEEIAVARKNGATEDAIDKMKARHQEAIDPLKAEVGDADGPKADETGEKVPVSAPSGLAGPVSIWPVYVTMNWSSRFG